MVPPIQPHIPKRHLQELLHRVRVLGRHDVIVGLLLLQHHPHGLDIVPGEAPVPRGLEVPQEELVLEPDLDPPHGAGDLPGHEVLAPPRLMVEQDPIAGEDPISLPVIDRVPMRRAFRRGIGRSRVERRRLALRRGRRPEHLRRSGLVVPDVGPARGGDVRSDGLEEAERAGGDHVRGVVRDFEGDGDVGLGGQVVDLVGENNVEPAAERGGIGEVGVVELHPGLVGIVRIDVDVIDPLGVEVRGPSDQAMDLVALVEEKLRQVRPVLTRYTRNQGNLSLRGIAVDGGLGFGSGSGGFVL
ncbi:LOW QUALITY PROTEIN: hypothetical protein PanWU01x14_306780 [Parasponia andersonii]|uniref:Uncharacterized protein n=1 Tax=Parasponia andersonii TaxID=3476 RepID=A0A2P5ARL7_PARAD|nr:LOW QUALITY PROTEIN: hypothetical protein PanWU01x14_306780 [Parasponia andersonii]